MTTAAPLPARRWPPSVIPLLLVNAIPLVGVLAHHWTVFVVALVGSHGFSFVHNYLANGEYRRVQLTQLMTLPYRRVAVLHITILGGGLLVTALGSPRRPWSS